jgi:hypothetical protein
MFFRVTSDCFDNQLMTKDAYKEVKLQMSTGDYHAHTAYEVDISKVSPIELVFDLINPVEGTFDYIQADIFQTEAEIKQFWAKQEDYYAKPKQVAEIKQFDLSKQKDLTPRQRLIKNQRKLFGIEATVTVLSVKVNGKIRLIKRKAA